MQDPKENKKVQPPAENKRVRIKFRQNRAAEGVKSDADGYASVDAKTADWLIAEGYADLAEVEKE